MEDNDKMVLDPVFAVGRLERHSNRYVSREWAVAFRDYTFILANPSAIPPDGLHDGEYHLFRCTPVDQFCYYVDPATIFVK